MKKSFMTRVLATGLSFAMAFSMAAATSVTTASAATKPAMITAAGASAKSLSLNVGETAKIYRNAATKKIYKVSAAKASSTRVKTAVSKSGTFVAIKGQKATIEGKPSAVKVSFKVKKTGKTSKLTYTSKVTVVDPKPAVAELTEVTQKEARKFAATLSTAVEKAETADFAIVRKADNTVIPIKAVTLDEAKTGVTIETFVDLADGKEYTFTYTAKDEAKTASSKDLTVTAGKVEKLDLTTTNVTAGTADDGVKVVTKDATGVVLNTYSFSEAASKYINVTVTPATAGYRDGNKIFLPEVGNTATVKVEYHTYKYVDGKEEGAITETFTVTAVADATVMNNFVYTITTAAAPTEPAWASASFKENHQVAIGDTANAYFLFKDSKGNNKTKGYKVSSSDSNILVVAAQQLNGSSTAVAVKGAKEGTAYIIVKNSKDELVTTLPVTVVAKRVPTILELSTQAVTVSNSTSAGAVAAIAGKEVKACVKDQYGDKVSNTGYTATITPLSAPSGVDVTTMKAALISSLGAITTDGTTGYKLSVVGAKYPVKGSYVYKIEIKVNNTTVTNSLTINVSEPAAAGSATSYAIELDSDSIDLVVDKDNKTEKKMGIKVAQLEGGVAWDYLETDSIASISVKSADGKSELYVTSAGSVTCGAVVTSGTAATAITKEAKADTTYLVKITLQGGKDLTATFNTKDSQLPVTATITNISDSITATDVQNVLTCSTADDAKNYVEYFYDNQKLAITTNEIVEIKATQITGEKNITVHSVKIKVKVADDPVYTVVEVPVNKVFTTTSSAGWSGSTKVVAP